MRETQKRVLVAGHLCIDITPALAGRQAGSIAELLAPGKLVTVGAPDIHLGGVVANTGLAMQRFGADVRLCAKIGMDELGRMAERQMAAHNAQAHLIQDPQAASSYTVVIAPPGLDRVFLHHPGANDTFCSQDIAEELLEGVSHFHFGYPPLMKRMYANGGEELIALFTRAKRKGMTTSLDMAAVDPGSPAGQADWETILKRVLPLVDCFVPSLEETVCMLGRARYDAGCRRAEAGDADDGFSITRDAAPLAERLVGMGARVALLKCGAQGICYHTAGPAAMEALCAAYGLRPAAWENARGIVPAFVPDSVLSAAGAGDVSIAAFVTAMLRGMDLPDCVRLAAAAGACSLSAYDPLSALVPLEQLEQRIQDGWERQPEPEDTP